MSAARLPRNRLSPKQIVVGTGAETGSQKVRKPQQMICRRDHELDYLVGIHGISYMLQREKQFDMVMVSYTPH